ncbi:L-asparaginase II [Paenibacillus sp. DS2015]|uniref:asparaginase n=1 Tax=Paenibacillus sp. DS2015 TaxID=3373917 RepID=UPI003D195C76
MASILVKEYREGVMECAHSGHISIVDEQGKVIASVGDPHFVTFTRSSAKPFQAIPAIRGGVVDYYKLSDKEIAIMTASHIGEPYHIEILESFLGKIGIQDSQMICASSYPLDEQSKEDVLRLHGDKRKLFHNCAGKHLGLLAYSAMKGYPLETYAEVEHPLQQEIITTFADLAGIGRDQISLGVDGCGLPVFALPLSALATAYMKLACPERIEDESTQEAVRNITRAMNRYPAMVGGTGRVDSLILQDDNIVAKGGFKGVYCFGLKKEKIGISFKVLDGSEEEWAFIIQSILEQIGYSGAKTLELLKQHYMKDIYNDGGKKVGYADTVFQLNA